MANSIANRSLAGTSSGSPLVLFDCSAGDRPCKVYTVRNRDATNAVRVLVSGLHAAGEDGAVVGPGERTPFHGAHLSVTKVVAWAEAGSPSIDGFVEARE